MKRIVLSVLFIGLFKSVACLGQVYVNGVAIDTVNTPYCQLICSNATVMTRTTVLIDHGQRYVSTRLNRQKIAGPDKQPITFNSSIDALNFMVSHGWELVSFQVTGNSSGSESTFVYMLQRKKSAKETD